MCLGGPRRLHRLAESLDDGGVGHAAALTHRLQAVPSAALFERVDECGHDAGTASAEWVTDGDGTAVDVRPLKMPVCSPSTSFAHASTIGANTLIVCWTAISLRLVRADAPRPLTC